jgi:hypothetical protein
MIQRMLILVQPVFPLIVRLNNHFNSVPNGAIAGGTVSTTGV